MLDVQTAYLNVDVKEEVYVKIAPDYENYGMSGTLFVMMVENNLHGLRQSPKSLFGKMDSMTTLEHRFPLSTQIVSVRLRVLRQNTSFDIVTICVGCNRQLLSKQTKQLADSFELTEFEDVSRVLRNNVTPDRKNGTMTINPNNGTEDILGRYCMTSCRSIFTPGVESELSLNQPEDNCWKRKESIGTSPSPARCFRISLAARVSNRR